MRRPGATDRRGTRIAGYDPSGALQALIASLGGWWWDGRTGIVIAGSGVSSWTDRVQGFVLSQGTDANRPAYANATVTFDGTSDYLSSASNPLTGKAAFTMHIVGSLPAWGAGTPVLWDSGGGGGARAYAIANGVAGLVTHGEAPAGTINEWTSGATTFPSEVLTMQCDLAQGAAATTALLANGTSLGGSRTTAGAVSGSFVTGGGFFVAATVVAALFANMSARGIVLLPTVAAANNAQAIPLLRSIYGV